MDPVESHRADALDALAFVVVTVSDSRTEADDGGGRAIVELASASGHRIAGRTIVRDEVAAIRAAVTAALEEGLERDRADVVVLTGGTGFSPRDVTIEAVEPFFERTIDGFGELFRMLSYREVAAAAMLSRATAGLAGGRAIFVLPGSPKAVRLAMTELILPEAGHLLAHARRR